MKNQTNKTALITGPTSGIGKELAIIHAQNGGDLVLVARSTDVLKELQSELKEKYAISVSIITADLSKVTAGSNLYKQIQEKNITVDYLINNAGFGKRGYFHESDLDTQLDMINLNVVALTELTRLFVADFVTRGNGRVLNVSSIAGLVPGPMQAVYFASKAYVTSFSNALNEEVRGTGVTVTNLMPGATKTKFFSTAGFDSDEQMAKSGADPRAVALSGYDAMLAGKLNVMAGVSWPQRLLFFIAPLLPKRLLLTGVKKLQTKK